MIDIRQSTLALVLIGGISFSDLPFAFSADVSNSEVKIQVPTLKDSAPIQTGKLLVIVFKDGLPASDIAIKAGKQSLKTNSAGVASFELLAAKQTVDIAEVGKSFTVSIVADQESEVVVNLLSNKNEEKAKVDVAAPENETQTITNANLPKQPVQFKITAVGSSPVAEATVLFSGVNTVYKTDAQGNVTADLAPGNYAVSFFHPEYQTQTISDFKVTASGEGAPAPVAQTVQLRPATNELEEVLVLAPKIKGSLSSLVEIRKQSSAVTDVLGAEQMARAGDSDAASSLRRVTGLTLVGGKYVYVRGLGERYSGVQMNQFSLPSPEPSRRVVPLDLFPTSIMESIIVQKSYSPNLPGEFGGGVIQLRTRTLPEKFFFRGNITNNFENSSNRLSSPGGSKDWLGMDDGSRALPQGIQNVLAQGKKLEKNNPATNTGISEAELVNLSKTLPTNYGTENTSQPSLPGMSLAMGNGWRLGSTKIGIAGSTLYGQNSDVTTRTDQNFNVVDGSGKLAKESTKSTVSGEVETRLAGSLDLGIEIAKKHKITASTFLLRNTTNLTQIETTERINEKDSFETTTQAFTERQLWTRYLKGENQLEIIPLKIDWRYGLSNAKRDSPDRRETTYDILQGNKTINSSDNGNTRNWSSLKDESTEKAFDLTLPIKYQDRDVVKLQVGMNELDKDRSSNISRFAFAPDFASTNSPFDPKSSPNELFKEENRRPGGYLLKNLANAADTYTGEQSIRAQYAMMEVNPTKKWSLQAGFRQEKSEQQVNTFNYLNPGKPTAFSNLKMDDTLPAYSVTWKPTDALRARLAYSETLARPDFRELSTVGFIDDETGYDVQGNAELKGTVIKNIDHRWEYYFSADEYISFGAFYKKFKNPIEVTFLPGVNLIQSFQNSPEATNIGAEVEGRLGLRNFSRALRRWTILSNATFIKSEITTEGGIQTSTSRPLQGQSPYVFNMQIQYDRPNWGFSSTLLYNIIGKRITEVGTNDRPDTYEQALGQLDFVSSLAFKDNWTLGFRARNLLDPTIEATQGDEVVRSQKRGRVFSVVLGAVF